MATDVKESFDKVVSGSRLPDVCFWNKREVVPKIKKFELEHMAKSWTQRTFDLLPALQPLSCLFPGGWIDDSVIFEFINNFFKTNQLQNDFFLMDPVLIQGIPTTIKRSPLNQQQYVFFPFNWKRIHWCLFVLEIGSGRVLIFDSLQKIESEYRESVLCFLYICKFYLGIKNLPSEKKVLPQVIPPSMNRSSWTFPPRARTNNSAFLKNFKVVPSWQQDNDSDCGPFTILNIFYLVQNNLCPSLFESIFSKKSVIFPKIPNNFMNDTVRAEVFFTLFVLRKREFEALDQSFSDTSFF